MMKQFVTTQANRVAAAYKSNKFAVWFFVLSWLFLSVITSQKTHLYILQSDQPALDYRFAYFRGFLTWTLIGFFFPFILKMIRFFPPDGEHYKGNLLFHLLFSIGLLFPLTFLFTLVLYYRLTPEYTFWQEMLFSLMWLSLIVPIAYWFIIGGVQLTKNISLFHERQQKASARQSELKEIQLKVLQAQLGPHFLFNALNTVSALTFEDNKAAVEILKKIRRYMELSVKKTDNLSITLEEELHYTRLYLDIEKERFSDRLQVHQEVHPDINAALVPNMLLQPLVENAVKHGIAREKGPGKLILRAGRTGRYLLLEVEDSGKGFETIGLVKKGGLGIKNTIERLQKLYNEDYRFEINRSALGGAKVSVKIPYHEHHQNHYRR